MRHLRVVATVLVELADHLGPLGFPISITGGPSIWRPLPILWSGSGGTVELVGVEGVGREGAFFFSDFSAFLAIGVTYLEKRM